MKLKVSEGTEGKAKSKCIVGIRLFRYFFLLLELFIRFFFETMVRYLKLLSGTDNIAQGARVQNPE